MPSIDTRRERHRRLSAAIAQIDDKSLGAIFGSTAGTAGWGQHGAISVGEDRVFVKSIPLTDLELHHPYSTRNLFELPNFYSYGIGSLGSGAYRELALAAKATEWVLSGETEGFPLLYHHRVCPRVASDEVDRARHERYVEFWGGDANIGRFALERGRAEHALLLFFEPIPHVAQPWLIEHPDQAVAVLRGLKELLAFLRKQGVVHFDIHYDNVLTDGETVYLADFGLGVNPAFDLSREERTFLDLHVDYDLGQAISCLSYLLDDAYRKLPEGDERRRLVGTAAQIDHAQALGLPESYAEFVRENREVICLMRDFNTELRAAPRKDVPVPAERMRRLLGGSIG